MPRSASDATRFTSTTPHATKPFYPATANPGTSRLPRSAAAAAAGPAGETPQQKVVRLREAARRAREARVSGFDRVVVRGRVWADRAHRVTALGLIGITCVAGVVTVYALGDMVMYNRRKKREYFAEQKAMQEVALQSAEVALRDGRATEEQIELLEQQRGKGVVAAEVNARARQAMGDATKGLSAVEKEGMREKKGILASATGWLFSGLKKEDTGPGEGLGYETSSSEDERVGEQSGVLRAVEARRAERERERQGGQLDRLGTETEGVGEGVSEGEGAEKAKKGGWTSFMTRK